MNGTKREVPPVGVMVVGPDARSQGGIAAVIANYRRTSFWRECNCEHFSTCADWAWKWARMLYSAWRGCVFVPTVVFKRPAVVSIHTADRSSFYRKLFYIVVVRLFSIPVVVHVHPASFVEFFVKGNRLTRFAITTVADISNRIVFLSDIAASQFRELFPHTRMAVIPNPVDVDRYGVEPRAPMKDHYRILFMGWIVREKGVYDIVDAMPDVLARFPQAEFLFAGNKETEQLKNMIDERQLSRHAKVLGWVEGREKYELLMSSRLLLLPSYSEGIPNVILEAMASGLPVVTTPVGGIPSVFVEGETGYFVSPGNPRELSARIVQMLSDDEDCEKISRSSRQRVKALYDLEVIGRQLEHLYREFQPQPSQMAYARPNGDQHVRHRRPF
ncbi:glycosyltransferase family 4 protein [Nitrospira sp. KM1]|uniref:glycosyltransferase family 4 protein n=1 Tax=Nitrospira sp. KM1 TaxID=1936990 RepID=UPI001564CBEE|nr:glycosyltransferase family 4 protein [Nitrospira sp. KM1]